jgi:hypothetical protein
MVLVVLLAAMGAVLVCSTEDCYGLGNGSGGICFGVIQLMSLFAVGYMVCVDWCYRGSWVAGRVGQLVHVCCVL